MYNIATSNYLNSVYTIISMDANTHSCRTVLQGRELDDFINHHNLNLINTPLDKISFVPLSTTFIDVTIIGHNTAAKTDNWRYLSTPSLQITTTSISRLNSDYKIDLGTQITFLQWKISISTLPENR